MIRTAWKCCRYVLVSCFLIALVNFGLSSAQVFIVPEILERIEERAIVTDLLATVFLFSMVLFLLSAL